jgi:acyl-CoA synthetase (AMP-forming)/AMP-acid ligase II
MRCEEIGKIAKPRKVWIVPDMPKTRSGKIMRRVLGAISNKGDVGDVMTLANPEIVEEIKKWSEITFQKTQVDAAASVFTAQTMAIQR